MVSIQKYIQKYFLWRDIEFAFTGLEISQNEDIQVC